MRVTAACDAVTATVLAVTAAGGPWAGLKPSAELAAGTPRESFRALPQLPDCVRADVR